MKYIDITFENFGKKHLDQSEHLGINNAWLGLGEMSQRFLHKEEQTTAARNVDL